jgi:hypothetical protein
MDAVAVNQDIQQYLDWISSQKHPRQAAGCFFIFGETVQPYFWDNFYYPQVSLLEAWMTLCEGWLNKAYGMNLTPLYPHVIKGVVESGKILLGNDCPFYLDDIRFNFSLDPSVDYEIDSGLSVDLNIPPELAILLRLAHKESPYYERLPAKIRFHKKDYGSPTERSAALHTLVERAVGITKVKRFGSLPSLVKPPKIV